MIIDRSKSQQEIDTQIDQLDKEFQKAEGDEEIPELGSESDQYYDGFGGRFAGGRKDGPPPFRNVGAG